MALKKYIFKIISRDRQRHQGATYVWLEAHLAMYLERVRHQNIFFVTLKNFMEWLRLVDWHLNKAIYL